MVEQTLKNFCIGKKTRASASFVFFVLLASCASSDFFPLTTKKLPELIVPHSVPNVPNNNLLTVAKERYISKNYPEAMLYYEQAVIAFPDNDKILLAYAASADMSGQFKISDRVYQIYEKKFGANFGYHNNFGYSNMLQGKYKKARKHFQEALRFEPYSERARNNLELLKRVENK